jgi:hypothetical protein
MWTRAFRAGAALLLAGILANSAGAKPPDLPVNYQDTFSPITNSEVIAQVPNNYEVPPPDPLLPIPLGEPRYEDGGVFADITGFIYMSESIHASKCVASGSDQIEDSTADVARMLTARRIFHVGERCLRKGDLDMAANCYQEVHLLTPTSRYGQIAMERLSEIESRKTDAANSEEQESVQTEAPDASKLNSAREMYRIGQRCLKAGDLDMAFNCFHETRLICPNCRYALLAARGLRQIEALRTSDETAEPDEGQEAPGTEPEDQAAAPTAGPIAKPVKKKFLLKGMPQFLNEWNVEKPQIKFIEGSSWFTPEGGLQQDWHPSNELGLPLYVSPAPGRLTIKQECPWPVDE